MSHPFPDDLVTVDPERGVIRVKGHRFWLGNAMEFVSLQKVLEELMGKGASAAVYGEGVQTSRAFLATFRSVLGESLQDRSPKDVFEEYLRFFQRIGYGRFEVAEFTHGAATVRLHDSLGAESHGPAKAPVCTVIAGTLAGLAEAVWNLPEAEIVCTEKRCAAVGDSVCEFTIAAQAPG